MASIKLKFRPSTVLDKEGVIYYQIIHERKVRQLLTNYHIFSSEWDEKRTMIIGNGNSDRFPFLLSLREHIRWDMERLNRINKSLESKGLLFSADDIIDEFYLQKRTHSFFNFMNGIIDQLKQLGKIRTSENYTTTFNCFYRFREGKDIMLENIDSDLMQLFESYLLKQGITLNSISFYMRNLRATYNRAIEKGIIEQHNPFRHVYTGIAKTVKRALPIKAIKKIKELDLSKIPHLEFARDLFMFSFYTRGMSFIDMAFLKKSELKNGILSYRRHKTKQRLHIRWEYCMQDVINQHPATHNSPYLLPIIKDQSKDERRQYLCELYKTNQALKKIAQLANIDINLTLYVARHSWASIARSKKIPISIISEGMGHDSETTTLIYLTSIETSAVNRANAQILSALD